MIFIAFLVRELAHDKPLVNLRVFAHRNFALGCILIALFGGVIYGMVTLLPLFYQELMGYTALNAGTGREPARHLGAIVAMPVIGILTSKIDNRWLIAFGFALFGICSLWLGQVVSGYLAVVAADRSSSAASARAGVRAAVDHAMGADERKDRQCQRLIQSAA